jgi:hypothetical protein
MTTLVVEELVTTLTQEFTLSLPRRAHVDSIRPHLYTHNTPAGTFTLSILDLSDNLIASKSFTAQEIYDAIPTTNDYAQAYFRINFDNKVHLPSATYKLRLSSSGYTFSESSYMGWVRDHEDLKVTLGYTPASDLTNPLSYEIWVNHD